MIKKEKIFVLVISIVIILTGLTILLKKDQIEQKFKNSKNLSSVYEVNEKKRIEKRFDAKIKNDKLRGILNSLSIDKLEIANTVIENDKLVEFLNAPNIQEYIDNIDYEKAVENSKIAKSLKELELLSPELERYLKDELLQSNYDKSIQKLKDRPEVIKTRKRITKLLPIKSTKNTLENLSENELMKISEILSNSPTTIEFVEKKDIKKYNLNQIVEISKTLYQIGKINPELAIEIEGMTNGLNIRKAALYGDLYVKDEEFENIINKEYEKENYTFENPFVKYNPYGRTPLSYGIKYNNNGVEDLIRVTVLGIGGMPNLSYIHKYNGYQMLPIVGLYPKKENVVLLEVLNPKSKTVLKSQKLKLKTFAVDDRLPAISIEKRVSGSIQPGFNLVSYNLKEEAIPFAFDSMGNMRYILKTGKDIRRARIEKIEPGIWDIKNDEDKFQLNLLGKILGRIGREENKDKDENKKTKYLIRNNNLLTVTSYMDGSYPSALFSEYGLDSKEEVFRAVIYYDKDGADENLIQDGERVMLYEGDSEE